MLTPRVGRPAYTLTDSEGYTGGEATPRVEGGGVEGGGVEGGGVEGGGVEGGGRRGRRASRAAGVEGRTMAPLR